jgi:hypothetical protein
MERESRERTNFSQSAAKEKMKGWLAQDSRFKDFDHDALVDRVGLCRSNGAVLDLDSQALKRGSRNRY